MKFRDPSDKERPPQCARARQTPHPSIPYPRFIAFFAVIVCRDYHGIIWTASCPCCMVAREDSRREPCRLPKTVMQRPRSPPADRRIVGTPTLPGPKLESFGYTIIRYTNVFLPRSRHGLQMTHQMPNQANRAPHSTVLFSGAREDCRGKTNRWGATRDTHHVKRQLLDLSSGESSIHVMQLRDGRRPNTHQSDAAPTECRRQSVSRQHRIHEPLTFASSRSSAPILLDRPSHPTNSRYIQQLTDGLSRAPAGGRGGRGAGDRGSSIYPPTSAHSQDLTRTRETRTSTCGWVST